MRSYVYFIALISGLFYAFLFPYFAKAQNVEPTLRRDCNFSNFIEQRLTEEKAHFSARYTDGTERHFVDLERRYDQNLALQVRDCYEGFLRAEFQSCDLAHISADHARFEPHRDWYAEYDAWHLIRGSYKSAEIILAARTRYLQMLGYFLSGCFTRNSVERLNATQIDNIYFAVAGAYQRQLLPRVPFVPTHQVVTRDRRCGRGDGCVTTIHMAFNGIVVDSREDTDDESFHLEITAADNNSATLPPPH